jgi:hypothetical protein
MVDKETKTDTKWVIAGTLLIVIIFVVLWFIFGR